jgi:PEP-CTERM motif
MKLKFLLIAASAALSMAATPALAVTFVAGDVFAAVGNSQVKHYSSTGVLIETLNTTVAGSFNTGMAFDTSGNLFVTNFSAGNISKFNNAGTLLSPAFVTTGSTPESIVFNAAGEFLVGHAGPVKRYSATGTLLQTYANFTNDWIDLAADQKTLFHDDEGLIISRFDLSTNSALAPFANIGLNGGTNAFALRILGNGDVIVAGGSKVLQYNAAGAFLGSYDVTGIDGFFALNLDSTNNTFWSGSFANQTLYRFTIGNYGANASTQTIVAGGSLFGVAVFGESTVAVPVPEASTWAMMIAGFGLIGGLSRRRRQASVALV